MHDCPNCDRKCDCDGEDSEVMSKEWVSRHCVHECEEDEEDGGWAINKDHSDSLWDSEEAPDAE